MERRGHVDGLLATAVLAGLAFNAVFGWWFADPLASVVIVIYGVLGGLSAFRHQTRHGSSGASS